MGERGAQRGETSVSRIQGIDRNELIDYKNMFVNFFKGLGSDSFFFHSFFLEVLLFYRDPVFFRPTDEQYLLLTFILKLGYVSLAGDDSRRSIKLPDLSKSFSGHTSVFIKF